MARLAITSKLLALVDWTCMAARALLGWWVVRGWLAGGQQLQQQQQRWPARGLIGLL
jgi:hypothetical protein